MKDFDFDELDRAVSSVLDGQDTPAKEHTPVAPRENINVSSDVERAPVIDVPARPEVVTREVAERPSVSRPVGPRSMDIVRPATAVKQPVPAPIEVQPVPEVPERPRTVVAMNDIRALPRAEVQPLVAPIEEPEIEAVPEEDSWVPPVDSPFLPDAKVEKRPLGTSEPTGVLDTFEAIDLTPAPVVEELSVPPIESEVALSDAPADKIGFAPMSDSEAESVPEFSVLDTDDAAPLEVTPEIAEQAPVADVSEYTAPVAITQQYTPKASADEEVSGEIFDTESYHQPFAAQKKKKSGPLKVILIVALIVAFGAAAGAGFYFYVLPML